MRGDEKPRYRKADFDRLVRATISRVYHLAYRLTGNSHDASDVVQETYLRAYRGIEKFRGESSVDTWLYRICVNTATTYLARRGPQVFSREVEKNPVTEPAPEEGVASEEKRLIRQALMLLPEGMRAVVVLKDVFGFSHSEVAQILGITESAAKVRLHRAHQRLRLLLEGAFAGSIDERAVSEG